MIRVDGYSDIALPRMVAHASIWSVHWKILHADGLIARLGDDP